jgi:hypothetical protein
MAERLVWIERPESPGKPRHLLVFRPPELADALQGHELEVAFGPVTFLHSEPTEGCAPAFAVTRAGADGLRVDALYPENRWRYVTLDALGRPHSYDDQPAICFNDKHTVHCLHGLEHRANGLPSSYAYGTKIWRQNGYYGRSDGCCTVLMAPPDVVKYARDLPEEREPKRVYRV